MIRHLVQLSIRHPGVVVSLAVSAVAYGVFAVSRAKFDVYPEFAPPQVVVQTETPGLSPEQVETLVTRPIENAVGGAGGLEALRSQSIQGLSVVTATFREGTDIFRARQIVSERLSEAASRMPQGMPAPTVAPLTSSTSMMFAVGLTSDTRSLMELRTFADWTLKPRLLGVEGVSKVAVFGGEARQIQVQILPERLSLLGVSIDEVIETTRRATGVRGAGFVEAEGQRVVLRTEGQAASPEVLGDLFVRPTPAPGIRLKDVARIADGPEPPVGDALVQDRRGVVLVVSSQYGANTLDVTQRVEKALDELRPLLAAERVEMDPTLFRPASFIERAIANVTESLLLGGVLVAVVLFLFLWDLRSAAISLTAIPLSLLAAIVILDAFGATLNTLTLGGLAIAIGEVVDDAIIDVENIHRRLKENREKESVAA